MCTGKYLQETTTCTDSSYSLFKIKTPKENMTPVQDNFKQLCSYLAKKILKFFLIRSHSTSVLAHNLRCSCLAKSKTQRETQFVYKKIQTSLKKKVTKLMLTRSHFAAIWVRNFLGMWHVKFLGFPRSNCLTTSKITKKTQLMHRKVSNNSYPHLVNKMTKLVLSAAHSTS